MDRLAMFLQLVQTGAICYTLGNGRSPFIAVGVLALAQQVPIEALPDNLEQAAGEYLEWQYQVGVGQDRIPRPDWFPRIPPYDDED